MSLSNKKGFTLTELLAVIVIIGIIAGIAIPLYNNLRAKTLETTYQNEKSTIEVAAEKYASETEITETNVETLIKAGYLSADDETGNIYDPRDKTNSLNCYAIYITEDNGNYNADMTEKKVDTNNQCDTSFITSIDAMLCNGSACTDDWYKISANDKLTLSVDLSKLNITSTDGVTYQWSSLSGARSNKDTYEINGDIKTLNTDYTVIVTSGGKQYRVSHKIKIDNEAPVILNAGNEVNNDKWEASKTIIINATDGNGSGIKGYYFSTSPISNCGSVNYTNDNYLTVNTNSTYYYCVIDNAGNYNDNHSSNGVDVEKLDNLKPTNVTFIESDNDTTIIAYDYPKNDDGSYQHFHAEDNFNLTFSSTNSLSEITYYYGFNSNSLNSKGQTVNLTKVNDNSKIIYVKACNEAGTCSDISSYHITFIVIPNQTSPSSTQTPFSSGSGSSGGYSGGYSGGASASICNATCQMKANSNEWNEINSANGNCYPNCSSTVVDQLNSLHGNNVTIANGNVDCKGGCNFNDKSGIWTDSTGKPLYGHDDSGTTSSGTTVITQSSCDSFWGSGSAFCKPGSSLNIVNSGDTSTTSGSGSTSSGSSSSGSTSSGSTSSSNDDWSWTTSSCWPFCSTSSGSSSSGSTSSGSSSSGSTSSSSSSSGSTSSGSSSSSSSSGDWSWTTSSCWPFC